MLLNYSLKNHYDFIIAGGGMAGLSLAYYLTKSELLKDKTILLIDKEPKTKNDRTWCFWEKEESAFEEIIYRKWNKVKFIGTDFSEILSTENYQYKMLRGIDFYDFILPILQNKNNIDFLFEEIKIVQNNEKKAELITLNHSFSANYIFDSTFQRKSISTKYHNLLQHFKGYIIKTNDIKFDTTIPLLMDFQLGISTKNECEFMYILPINEQTALVEFTLFSEKLLPENEYDFELKKYIQQKLKINNYEILEEEFGVIPMSDAPTEEFVSEIIIRIVTAGGYTHSATGYTFKQTQKNLQEIVRNLEKTGKPTRKNTWFQQRFSLYSSVLLNVLQKKRSPASIVFTELYKKNSLPKIFKFLDNETTFSEEIQLMFSMTKNRKNQFAFITAAFDVLKKRIVG